jgi:hypothetical protein
MDRNAKLRDVTGGAKYVYAQMLERRQLRENLQGGRDQLQIVCDVSDSLPAILPWLDELRKANWIYGDTRTGVFVLGYVVLKPIIFGITMPIEEEIDLLLSRYTPSELQVVNAALDALGERKSNKRLTHLEKRNELEYWTQFDPRVVQKGLQVYLKLSNRPGYGPEYVRGILRNEALKSAATRPLTGVNGHTPTLPKRAAEPSERARHKADWVRGQTLARWEFFQSLPREQQQDFMGQLEAEYEAEHANES